MASNLVLIPGAGEGAWAWQPVVERLCAAGHAAVPITLPGMRPCDDRSGHRLLDAAHHVIEKIDRREWGRVVLVAHSLGGMTLAMVAARIRERLDQMVFVSAFIPLPGESFAEAGGDSASVLSRAEASPDGTTSIAFDVFAASLMKGEPEEAQRVVHNLFTSTPGGYSLDPYDGPDLTELGAPARYIVSEDDYFIRPPAELAARLGVEPVVVPGTHEALVTHPDAVAAAILDGLPG